MQQNNVAVFSPLKALILKESADFVLSRRVFANGCSVGVHDFLNTGCSGCSGGCSQSEGVQESVQLSGYKLPVC